MPKQQDNGRDRDRDRDRNSDSDSDSDRDAASAATYSFAEANIIAANAGMKLPAIGKRGARVMGLR